jgi:hypothetical protein
MSRSETERVRGNREDSWEERFPRYAHNAGVTAERAADAARWQRKASAMHAGAATNAHRHGDLTGAGLYAEMAKAALDAADALNDVVALARKVEEHYEGG